MCDINVTRRGFLGGGVGGFFAFAMNGHFGELFAQDSVGKAKRCVVLWMNGGPSQIDTFDPKPGTDTGGEFRAIDTAVRGMKIGEHLPQIAKRMKNLSIVRSMSSREGDHERARYLLHTGYPLIDGFGRPGAGSVVSKEAPEAKFPKYVSIGSPGFGPAYMGPANAPFSIQNPQQALNTLRAIERRRDRIKLMRELEQEFVEQHPSGLVDQRTEVVKKIEELIDTKFVKALDMRSEPEKNRRKYGQGTFAQGCLLARRLLEVGVNFVEVFQNGWDTHQNNFTAVRNLCRGIDRPWAALMDDLDSKGLLEETIVLWMGEFGRTPQINSNNGRDHYPGVTSAVIGGGGIPGGRIVGQTSKLGTRVTKGQVTVPDLFATMFKSFGIDPQKKYYNKFGGTAMATDSGVPIKDLA